ncbi:metallophosphoesterase family protein [Alistipes sp. OttesenSCG-928-B03]|nr:metallophosphoesterase family protein [Alistipes sp. OttesenSCG-928-B03]
MKKIVLLATAILSFMPGYAQMRMNFGTDGKFRILQITDLHIKPSEGKSDIVFESIDALLTHEKPDLIAFTGDIVYDTPARPIWEDFIAYVEAKGIPWTLVFGNHDREFGMTNAAIMEMLVKAKHALLEAGPEEVSGVGNFVIELAPAGSETPSNVMYFMDSHRQSHIAGLKGYGWIDHTQIAWYRAQSQKYGLPAVAFFHIPLREFREAALQRKIGNRLEEECASELNSGLFTAMMEQGDVSGIFVGHEHDNDYITEHHGIALAYGRMTGSRSIYGKLPRGGRVIVLTEGQPGFETYIRQADGEVLYRCSHPGIFERETDNEKTIEELLRETNPEMFE